MDYAEVLDSIERAMGPVPRRFGWLRRRKLHMRKPKWLARDSVLRALFDDQDLLLREGRTAWGAFAQVNTILFSDEGPNGTLNAPGDALHSEDPAARADPLPLIDIAHRLYDLKDGSASDLDRQRVGEMLADEVLRKSGEPIPASLSPEFPTFMTSIFVDRRHLPLGYVSGTLLPLLVLPEKTRAVMIVPCEFWPAAFVTEVWA